MSFVTFGSNDKRVLTETLTTSTWTNNQNSLTLHVTGTYGTSAEQNYTSPTSSANFYLNVYNTSSDSTGEIQYTVSYGNRVGSGSPDFTNDTGSMGIGASKVVYSQYRNLVFGNDTSNFVFGTHTPEDIYVINLQRGRLRNNLKPGSLNLWISGSPIGCDGVQTDLCPGGATQLGHTFKLTDDSVTTSGSALMTNLGRQYNIVSGTSGIMSGSTINQKGGSSS